MPRPQDATFVLFGPAHLGALAATVLATLALLALARRAPRAVFPCRVALALALAGSELAELLMAWLEGWLTPQIALPLDLCDISRFLAIVALLTGSRRANELLYFFALAGTLPALLTPELSQGWPSFRFLIYFVPHGLTVASALLLSFGLDLPPRAGGWWRAFLALNGVAVVAGAVNAAVGTNFLYLSAKPRDPTPFDWFGPWPHYILVLEGVSLSVFFLLDLPLRGRRGCR